MKRNTICFAVVFLVIFHLILASWRLFLSDVYFSSDIARDFFIFDEIKQKIFLFIGGRTSSGLFHGPLWWYINFPAYLIGHGNPIIVGWYWILLITLSLFASYFVAKKLFSQTVAYLYVIMLSVLYIFYANALINPAGAMLIMPLFFYYFIRYIETLRLKYLILELCVIGAMIQFEMAVGIPLLLLSSPIIIYYAVRGKRKKHLLSFLVISIWVSTFAIFDLRHNFILLKQAINFATPGINISSGLTYQSIVADRLRSLLYRNYLVRNLPSFLDFIPMTIMSIFLFLQIKQGRYKKIYFSFIYFFLGFFVLSFINKGYMLDFYLFPFVPLIILIFCSFFNSKYKKIFLLIFIIFYIFNLNSSLDQVRDYSRIVGKDENSWKFLYSAASRIFESPENKFGYFEYTPDITGYRSKYALLYAAKTHPKKTAYAYQKKRITFVLIAIPSSNAPYLHYDYWQINQLGITSKPEEVIKFQNGYLLEKFLLPMNEINTPVNYDIVNVGLHYR